jgi:hypothetical protein
MPQNFALTFISLIFRYEILYAKYVDLLDKLKEGKKSQFFPTMYTYSRFIFFMISVKSFEKQRKYTALLNLASNFLREAVLGAFEET